MLVKIIGNGIYRDNRRVQDEDGSVFTVYKDDLTFSHRDKNNVAWYHYYSSEDTEIEDE